MFVCTGNICRSAMAEFFLKKRAEEKGLNIEVRSCGTFASIGDISTKEAIQVMAEDYNMDLAQHRATNIQHARIREADLILCATLSHKQIVLKMFPDLEGKVYTMKEFIGEEPGIKSDISDPWGHGIEVYRQCAAEVADTVDKIADKLEKLQNE